MTAKSLSEGSI